MHFCLVQKNLSTLEQHTHTQIKKKINSCKVISSDILVLAHVGLRIV